MFSGIEIRSLSSGEALVAILEVLSAAHKDGGADPDRPPSPIFEMQRWRKTGHFSNHTKAAACRVAHRDIKPANVLLDREGRVKISDFGLAKKFGGSRASDDATPALTLPGTPERAGHGAPGIRGGPRIPVWGNFS